MNGLEIAGTLQKGKEGKERKSNTCGLILKNQRRDHPMNKHTLFDLRLSLEDLENSIEMVRTLERELTFTHERFQKESQQGNIDIKEYQHKLKFIDAVYYRNVIELEERFKAVNKIANKLYETAR